MTIEEMIARKIELANTAYDIRHDYLLDSTYRLACHWLIREIARYDNMIAKATARDEDGHELSESGRMSDDEYRTANSDQLRRWAERNEEDDNRPARQPRGL